MMMSDVDSTANRPPSPVLLGMMRGARRRCPNCGRGRLYRGYTTVASPCSECGDDNARHPADDAPPYFTILLVGHLIVGPMLFFPFIWKANVWLVVGATLPVLIVCTLALLPVIKGVVIGAQWGMGRGAPSATHRLEQHL